MADISWTYADIRPYNNYEVEPHNYLAGTTLYTGECVYVASADNRAYPADSNVDEESARGIGVIVETFNGNTSATAGHRVSVVLHGPVAGYSGMTPGAPIYVSSTAGSMTQTAPAAGNYSRVVGWAMTASVIWVDPCVDAPTSVSQ